MDAAIIFSDILVVPQAMGMEVQMIEGKGPLLPEPVQSEKDLQKLDIPDVNGILEYVFEAVNITKKTIAEHALRIVFACAAWT